MMKNPRLEFACISGKTVEKEFGRRTKRLERGTEDPRGGGWGYTERYLAVAGRARHRPVWVH